MFTYMDHMVNCPLQAPSYEEYLSELCLMSVLFFPSTSVQNHMTPISSHLKVYWQQSVLNVAKIHKTVASPMIFHGFLYNSKFR